MKTRYKWAALAVLPLALGACVTPPSGPSQLVLPGTGKSFDQFRADDGSCRDFAFQSIGGTQPGQVAADSTARSAVLGTAVGALAGAAIGGSGRGAAVGAGTGLLFGTAAGAGAGSESGYSAQRRYDNYYVQCMYAQGHRVPVSGQMGRATMLQQQPSVPPPPAGMPPPPPPPAGPPPAPPSGAAG